MSGWAHEINVPGPKMGQGAVGESDSLRLLKQFQHDQIRAARTGPISPFGTGQPCAL